MEIFISWSGQRSRACAEALNTWLPRVIQSVKPWISTHGIAKGTRWNSDIAKQLDQHIYGIICVTPENRTSTWLNFEAGALSKTDASRTFTFLIGLGHADVEQPLAQFNHTLATRDDVYAFIQSVNAACAAPLDADLLQHSFDVNWTFLEKALADILAMPVPKDEESAPSRKSPQTRDDNSMIRETLELVRHLTLRQNLRPRASVESGNRALRRELLRAKIKEVSMRYPNATIEWQQTSDEMEDFIVLIRSGDSMRQVSLNTRDPLEMSTRQLEAAIVATVS